MAEKVEVFEAIDKQGNFLGYFKTEEEAIKTEKQINRVIEVRQLCRLYGADITYQEDLEGLITEYWDALVELVDKYR